MLCASASTPRILIFRSQNTRCSRRRHNVSQFDSRCSSGFPVMFSLDTGDLRPGTTDKDVPASSASPRSSIASDASSVVSLISSALGELRRSSITSDPGTKGEVDANNPYQKRPSYTIGGTRSRGNSVSSVASDDILDDLPSATKSDVGSLSETKKSAKNIPFKVYIFFINAKLIH